MWKLTSPVKVEVLHELRPTHNVVFFCNEEPDHRCWVNVQLSMGRFTPASVEECLKEWPREAIRLLRDELVLVEAKLDEEEFGNETSLEGRRVEGGATQA